MEAVETKYPALAKARGEMVAEPKEAATPAEPAIVAAAGEPAATEATDAPVEAPKLLSLKDQSDDEKLNAINEALGTNYKSLSEIRPKEVKTKEQLASEKEQKKQKALSWGVENKKLTLDEYEKSIVDKSKPARDIALAVFGNELRADNPKIKDEEIEEMFKDYYREDLDTDSPVRMRLQRDMEKVAANYLKDNYGKIDTLETEYDSHESNIQHQEDYGRRIKTVSATLPKEIKFSIPHTTVDGQQITEEYNFPIGDADIKDAKKSFLTPEMYEAFGGLNANLKDDVLSAEMINYIKGKNLDKIVSAVASQHAEKANAEIIAKLKAVPVTGVSPLGGNAEAPSTKTAPSYPALKAAQDRARVK